MGLRMVKASYHVIQKSVVLCFLFYWALPNTPVFHALATLITTSLPLVSNPILSRRSSSAPRAPDEEGCEQVTSCSNYDPTPGYLDFTAWALDEPTRRLNFFTIDQIIG